MSKREADFLIGGYTRGLTTSELDHSASITNQLIVSDGIFDDISHFIDSINPAKRVDNIANTIGNGVADGVGKAVEATGKPQTIISGGQVVNVPNPWSLVPPNYKQPGMNNHNGSYPGHPTPVTPVDHPISSGPVVVVKADPPVPTPHTLTNQEKLESLPWEVREKAGFLYGLNHPFEALGKGGIFGSPTEQEKEEYAGHILEYADKSIVSGFFPSPVVNSAKDIASSTSGGEVLNDILDPVLNLLKANIPLDVAVIGALVISLHFLKKI